MPAGYRAAVNGADCNDANNTLWQNITGYADADLDTYTTGGGTSICSGAALPSGYRAAVNGADCNDANGAVWRNRYRDVDVDAYGAGAATCVGNEVGYVDNNTDCYDSNASAYPGQTAYFTTNRGDGSFDYNCDGLSSLSSPVWAYTPNINYDWYNGTNNCLAWSMYLPDLTCGAADYSCSTYYLVNVHNNQPVSNISYCTGPIISDRYAAPASCSAILSSCN